MCSSSAALVCVLLAIQLASMTAGNPVSYIKSPCGSPACYPNNPTFYSAPAPMVRTPIVTGPTASSFVTTTPIGYSQCSAPAPIVKTPVVTRPAISSVVTTNPIAYTQYAAPAPIVKSPIVTGAAVPSVVRTTPISYTQYSAPAPIVKTPVVRGPAVSPIIKTPKITAPTVIRPAVSPLVSTQTFSSPIIAPALIAPVSPIVAVRLGKPMTNELVDVMNLLVLSDLVGSQLGSKCAFPVAPVKQYSNIGVY